LLALSVRPGALVEEVLPVNVVLILRLQRSIRNESKNRKKEREGRTNREKRKKGRHTEGKREKRRQTARKRKREKPTAAAAACAPAPLFSVI
jgi:hypothetical protein